MAFLCFSLNVNGNWIDVRTEGFWRKRIIISHNGEPLVTGKWPGTGSYEFSVNEEGSRTVYNVEMRMMMRVASYVVRRNGVLLLVTERSRDQVLSRETEAGNW